MLWKHKQKIMDKELLPKHGKLYLITFEEMPCHFHMGQLIILKNKLLFIMNSSIPRKLMTQQEFNVRSCFNSESLTSLHLNVLYIIFYKDLTGKRQLDDILSYNYLIY